MPSSVHSFVAKIDINGTCIWAKNFGGNLFVGSPPLFDNDNHSNLYFLSYSPNSSFLDTFPVSSGGYLGKMDTDGIVSFIKKICRSDSQYPRPAFIYSKLIYKWNRLYVFGVTLDSVTIDTIYIQNTSFTNMVITSWDTTGSIFWARNSDNSNVSAGDFNVNDVGSVYVASGCDGPIITFQNDTVFVNSNNGGCLLKYDKDGLLQWHKSFISGQHVSFRSSVLDAEENVYFTGAFKDSVNFNFQTIYSSSNFNELYIACFDSDGSCLGVKSAGPADGFDILKSVNNEIYVTGELRNTATFGPISIPSYGSSDIFLANLNAITGLGGGEKISNNQLIIYANPNKGSFRLQVPDQLRDLHGAWLTVFDVQGKEVARFNLDSTEEAPLLEINNANSGFYTVRLVKDKKVFTGKLVVE